MRVNGRRIRQLRQNLDWTQKELGRRAGYTERMIRRMESCGPASRTTLEHVWEALMLAGQRVKYEDLVCDPVDCTRQFIEGMYTHRCGVIDYCAGFIHPDAVFMFSGDPAVFPFAGRHEGIDAGRRAFQSFFSILEPPQDLSELNHYDYLATAEGAMAWGETSMHPIGRPMSAPLKVAVRCDFTNGLMTLFDDRFDTQAGESVMKNG